MFCSLISVYKGWPRARILLMFYWFSILASDLYWLSSELSEQLHAFVQWNICRNGLSDQF